MSRSNVIGDLSYVNLRSGWLWAGWLWTGTQGGGWLSAPLPGVSPGSGGGWLWAGGLLAAAVIGAVVVWAGGFGPGWSQQVALDGWLWGWLKVAGCFGDGSRWLGGGWV